MPILRRVWEGWKRIAHRIGVVQTYIFLTIFYFLVLGVSALIVTIARRDLLRTRAKGASFYRGHPPFEDSIESYTHIT